MAKEEQKQSKDNGNKRVFSGSWFLVIAPFFVGAIEIWYYIAKLHLAGNNESTLTLFLSTWKIWEIIILTAGGAILYYFASRVPIKVLVARAKKQANEDEPNFFAMLIRDSFKGGTVKYDVYDSSHSFLRSEEHYVPGIASGLAAAPVLAAVTIIFYFIKAALVMYWAIFNFFRNYVLLWIFPKRYENL